MPADKPQPLFVAPYAGRTLPLFGITHKLTPEQTDGAYYLFEAVFGPGQGSPLHVHHREDEIGYVLEGALEIRLADQTVVVEAGGVTRLPKHLPHALRNPLATPARYLFLTIPAGLDQWFEAVEAAQNAGTLDAARYRQLSEAYGLEWLE